MSTTTTVEPAVVSFGISRTETIDASIEIVYESVLAQIGAESIMPDGSPFPMKFEAWPGGRWYRDLGNNAGHLWGHVQVIKPPTLLEICGPMFMSFAATNFVQYRLKAEGNGTSLKFVHNAIGQIPREYLKDMDMGWDFWMKRIRELAAKRTRR